MLGKTDNLKTLKKFIAAYVLSGDTIYNDELLRWVASEEDLDIEERCWLGWLYGCFYSAATVLWVGQNFKTPYDFTVDEFSKWHDIHGDNLLYQRNRIYVRGKLVEMVGSYLDVLDGKSQAEFYGQFEGMPPEQAFQKLYKEVNRIKHFGRFATFLSTEAVFHICEGKFTFQCGDAELKDASSSNSRKGLLYALGYHDKMDAKLTNKEYSHLDGVIKDIIEQMGIEFNITLDTWQMSALLCVFYTLTKGKRYIGYYQDRLLGDYYKLTNKVSGFDDTLFWKGRNDLSFDEYLGEKNNWKGLRKEMRTEFRDKALLIDIEPLQEKGLINFEMEM